jgi:ribosomal protein S18 acetylase RimI-like enzyme
MIITDFTNEHIEAAMQIAKTNYDEERQFVPILPQVEQTPFWKGFVDNKLGVAAFENNKMVGFLCCYPPRNNAFGTTNVKGTFSPIHAHGSVLENRDRIYSKLYQAASEKWVKQGILSHAIALYAHDIIGRESFFYNGFGIRCVDAIRPLSDIKSIDTLECEYYELRSKDMNQLLELKNLLIDHLSKSPIFCSYPPFDEEQLIEEHSRRHSRYFVAKHNQKIIAYVEIMDKGENFACDDSSMMNICGASCHPDYRGCGIYNNLLAYVVTTLKSQRYTRLGVDFESFNPTARGFWLKHFTQYTNSVVRRIDDNILKI